MFESDLILSTPSPGKPLLSLTSQNAGQSCPRVNPDHLLYDEIRRRDEERYAHMAMDLGRANLQGRKIPSSIC